MQGKKYYYSVGTATTDSVRVAQIKIKRSVFTCSLAFAASIEAAKAFITKVSKENKTATHNCWAYIVGETGDIFHSSDAGEPGGHCWQIHAQHLAQPWDVPNRCSGDPAIRRGEAWDPGIDPGLFRGRDRSS